MTPTMSFSDDSWPMAADGLAFQDDSWNLPATVENSKPICQGLM